MRKSIVAVLLVWFLLMAPVWAAPAGVFYVGEAEGENFHLRFEFQEGEVVVTQLLDRNTLDVGPVRFSMTEAGEQLYSLTATIDGRTQQGFLRQRSANEFIFWLMGGERLMLGVKAGGALPQGDWNALVGGRQLECHFSTDAMELVPRKQEVMGPERYGLLPVVEEHGELRAIGIPKNGNSFLLYFVELERDTYLVRNHEDNGYLLLYRGDGPGWIQREVKEMEKIRRSINSKASTVEKD